MTVDTPPPTPSDKDDKKEHRPPQGATHKVAWTDDAGRFADIDVISEWIVLRKKERPAAEVFHTYYRLAGPQGQSNRRRPVSFVFNGGPGASSAYLHVGGLSPRRVLFKTRWRSSGTHKVELVVLGTKGRPHVAVDRIVIRR